MFLKSLLKTIQVRTVPSREEDIAVIAIPSPSAGVPIACATKRFTVVAGNHKVRVRVVRGQLLDFVHCQDEVVGLDGG